MLLSDFFERAKTKNIVINSDIDGFLSGMVLQKYYDCKVVGFSNSKTSIWLTPDIESLRSPIYIDIFVTPPETFCIDQHIVAYNNSHIDYLLAAGTKMNPNLDISRRTYSGDLGIRSDYYHKYPFGTIHYLIALMKQDGFDVEFNDINQPWKVRGLNSREYTVSPAQIILRADDALHSSLGRYKSNTRIWWGYLESFNSSTIKRLKHYVDNFDPRKSAEHKRYIGDFFCNGLGCDSPDGAFDTITDPDGKLQARVITYNRIINELIGIEMDLPVEFIEHKGIAHKSYFNTDNLSNAFTYAFVCSPKKPNVCFSYTTDIE